MHKTQINSLRTKETLVDAPHKAVEKARMVNGRVYIGTNDLLVTSSELTGDELVH